MDLNNYVKGFNSYNQEYRLNEMASELTKLGVPKNLMQFIHKLSGKVHRMSQSGDTQRDPSTGRETSKFHTRKEPYRAKGGPWPEREDVPLSHDVQVNGTKTGKNNIYHYLTALLDSRKDVGLRLILVNPNQDQIHYVTRKTGKMSKAQLAAVGIHDEYRGRSATDQARELGTSNKRGLYMRVVTLDGDSGEPISAWEGTIGQMADDMDDDSVLYIMETEDRVRGKRTERTSRKELTADQFIKYFIDNFGSIANKFKSAASDSKSAEYAELFSTLTPDEFRQIQTGTATSDSPAGQKKNRMAELSAEIESGVMDEAAIKPELDSFQKKAMEEGEYSPQDDTYSGRQKARLAHMTEVHTMPVVATMFLQWLVLGKVYKKFYTDDPFKEMGVDDLLFDM